MKTTAIENQNFFRVIFAEWLERDWKVLSRWIAKESPSNEEIKEKLDSIFMAQSKYVYDKFIKFEKKVNKHEKSETSQQ